MTFISINPKNKTECRECGRGIGFVKNRHNKWLAVDLWLVNGVLSWQRSGTYIHCHDCTGNTQLLSEAILALQTFRKHRRDVTHTALTAWHESDQDADAASALEAALSGFDTCEAAMQRRIKRRASAVPERHIQARRNADLRDTIEWCLAEFNLYE